MSTIFRAKVQSALNSYLEILKSKNENTIFAGVPKYTTRTEISKDILNLKDYEDRGLLTFILEEGEYVGPVNIQKIQRPWQLNIDAIQPSDNLKEISKKFSQQ